MKNNLQNNIMKMIQKADFSKKDIINDEKNNNSNIEIDKK